MARMTTEVADALFLYRFMSALSAAGAFVSCCVSVYVLLRRNPPLEKVLADLAADWKEQLGTYVQHDTLKRELGIVDNRISGLSDSAARTRELEALKETIEGLREDIAAIRSETGRQINDLNRGIGAATAAADAASKAATAATAAAQAAMQISAQGKRT